MPVGVKEVKEVTGVIDDCCLGIGIVFQLLSERLR